MAYLEFDLNAKKAEQSDPPKSRIGRFLMVSFLAATSVIAGVRQTEMAYERRKFAITPT